MGTYGGFGWRRQPSDARDHRLLFRMPVLPAIVDLRPQCPPVYDQGQYGSCTANAACAAFEFDTLKQHLPDVLPSRMFEYYNARVLSGDAKSDDGSTIRDANKALNQHGVCTEATWPYTDTDLLQKPSQAAYNEALPQKISNYAAVQQDLASVQASLALGFPVQIGFDVYSSFESAEATATGIIPFPNVQNEQLLGGHAVLIVGYADTLVVAGQTLSHVFLVRNSWGTGWGDKGYCYIPQAYFLDPSLASDLWVINAVPAPPSPVPPTPPAPAKDCTSLVRKLLTCLGIDPHALLAEEEEEEETA